ncbi:tyrosine-type recombinase/integrase [Bizionia sp.]|uniref:tyrosine-type recombinase/integrase n=1 Tax=Bizionia sp. TaxID=1954480 RepID=UPI003A90CD99
MASLSFSYRSAKTKAFLEMRFAYRIEKNENPISFYTRSKIEVDKSYWKNVHSKNSKDPIIQKEQNRLNAEMTDLRTVVLDKFENTEIELISKDWFLNIVNEYYNPKKEIPAEIIPTYLVDYIPYYLKEREHEMKSTSVTKYNVIKKKLQRMETSLNKRFEILDINENFKKMFVRYYESQNYSQNTMHRELGFIKTICRHARTKDIPTSKELDLLKLEKDKVKHIYFSEKELKELETLKGLPPHLDNARDWLVISCHCGQRISDFLRFKKEMITQKQGVKLINFTQKKTGKEMSIALSGTIEKILQKRNGDFPHSISDQKYNDYIKTVCEKAGFDELVKGKKQENINKDKDEKKGKKKKKIRAVSGVFPKHELVTSHIGRRTFATLKRDSMPLSLLMSMTGHTTETALNTYLQMEEEDKAVKTFKYL